MIRWSFSRLSTAEQCAYKYSRRYRLRERGGKTTALKTGTIVHAVLEAVMRWVVATKHQGAIDLDMVLEMYGRLYREEYQEAGSSVISFEDGEQIVRDWASRVGPVDYERIAGIETEFEITLQSGITLMGFIDLIEHTDDGGILIRDYKTNRAVYSKEDIDSSMQLGIYTLAGRALWPGKDVSACYDMLRHGYTQHTERIDVQLAALSGYIATLVEGVQLNEKANQYPANVNRFCSWCDFKAVCPGYQDAINGPMPELAGEDWESVSAQREYLSLKAKLVKDALGKLDSRIRERCKEEGLFKANGRSYELVKTTRSTYPAVDTLGVLTDKLGGTDAEWLAQCGTLDKAKVKKAVRGADMSRSDQMVTQAAIDALAKTTHSSRLVSKEAGDV